MPLDSAYTVDAPYVPATLYVWKSDDPEAYLWTIAATDTAELKVLKAAYGRIKDPKNWCRASYAVNLKGKPVSPLGYDVHRVCAVGAMKRAEQDFGLPSGTAHQAMPLNLVLVNTFIGRRAALWMLRRAIDKRLV